MTTAEGQAFQAQAPYRQAWAVVLRRREAAVSRYRTVQAAAAAQAARLARALAGRTLVRVMRPQRFVARLARAAAELTHH